MSVALVLPGSLRVLNPYPADYTYGPFADSAAAISAIPLATRYDGLTVQITGSGNYWWLDGDLSDGGLLSKVSSSGGLVQGANMLTQDLSFDGDGSYPVALSNLFGGADESFIVADTVGNAFNFSPGGITIDADSGVDGAKIVLYRDGNFQLTNAVSDMDLSDTGVFTFGSTLALTGFNISVSDGTNDSTVAMTGQMHELYAGNHGLIAFQNNATPLTAYAQLYGLNDQLFVGDDHIATGTRGITMYTGASSPTKRFQITEAGSIKIMPAAGAPTIGYVWTATNADGSGSWQAASGGVTSVTGTSNRITSSGGSTPAIDISASYVGQASITTLGTIATGTWNATSIALGKGGTGSALVDPNANNILAWDDTDGTVGFWTLGSGHFYDHPTHTLSNTPPILGTIFTDNWASLASWTKVGAQTFTVSANQLSIVGGTPVAITFSNYYRNSGYGNSNLENFTVTDNITIGTINGTSWGVGYGFQPQAGTLTTPSLIVGLLMDSTNKGKIGFYFFNSATGAVVTDSALPISNGDSTTVKIQQIKDRIIVTWTNNTTTPSKSITASYSWDMSTTTTIPTIPNAYQHAIYALGGTHTSTGVYTVKSKCITNADYMMLGTSVAKGYNGGKVSNRYFDILNNAFPKSFVLNGNCYLRAEDMTPAEALAHTPRNIIIDGTVAVNAVGGGQSQATAFTNLQTLIGVLTGAGYVVGTNLFILTSIPYTSDITSFNASIRSTYPTGAIDVFYPLWSGTSFTIKAAYVSADGVHPNILGNQIIADTIANYFDFPLAKSYNYVNAPLTYSADGTLNITGNTYLNGNTLKMGIGTAVPVSALHLKTTTGGSGTGLTIENTASAQYADLQMLYNGTLYTQLVSTGATTSSGTLGALQTALLNYSGGLSMYAANAAALFKVFAGGAAAGDEKIRVSTSATNFLQKTLFGSITTTPTALVDIQQTALSTAWIPAFKVLPGTHTSMTASTEFPDNTVEAATHTWAAGTLTTQRYNWWKSPTVAFASASTATTVYNTYIDTPVAGTNATITNNFALGISGNLSLVTAGNGIYIKEGSNATSGLTTLVAGTAVVSTTKVTANSRIYLTSQNLGTIIVPAARTVSARTAATSFTILSSDATDTSTVAWLIIEPAP